MQRAGGAGRAHAAHAARPGADDRAHAVHELQRESAGLRRLRGRVLSGAERRRVSGAVRARHLGGRRRSPAPRPDGPARGGSVLRHGAAGLPLAERAQRAAADVGADTRISHAGVHGHPRGERGRVGAADVHTHVARGGKCRREPAGRGGTDARAGVRAAGLRRLARRDRARDRAAGQGDGAVHARRAARRRPDGGAAGRVLPSRGGKLPRVHGAVRAVCGGAGGHAAGAWQHTYGDAVACAVTHYFVLDLFPACNTTLYQYLSHTGQT